MVARPGLRGAGFARTRRSETGQHAAGPSIDIVIFHDVLHRLHAQTSFLSGHCDGVVDGVRELFRERSTPEVGPHAAAAAAGSR
jgi:hypothetical protein